MDYLRKNNKKILAVVGIFLMIAFIIPSVAKQGHGPGEGQNFGHVGKEAVLSDEYNQARYQWDILSRQRMISTPFGPITLAEAIVAQKLGGGEQGLGMAQGLIRKVDVLDYLLLLREARRMNMPVNAENLKGILDMLAQQAPTDDPIGREQALSNWMMVMEAFDRVADAAKITPALARKQVADTSQQISLKLVEFKAEQFKSGLATPTRQQLQDFFDKHKAEDQGAGEMGLGYRYPNRIAIQYIRVPLPEFRKKISAEEVYKEYKDHTEQYPSTQPAATAPSTQPNGKVAAATPAPTTKPISERLEEVKDRVRDQLARNAAASVAKSMTQLFAEDWPAYRQAVKEKATTQPSKLGVDYASERYLQKVADRVQGLKDAHGVRPVTVNEIDPMSVKELSELPGIGKAYLLLGRQPLPVAYYALKYAEMFLSDAERKQAMEMSIPTLALFQPSPVFRDSEGNLYIFRIVTADAAHVPGSLDLMEKKVREDYLTAQAFQKAKEAANQCLTQAKTAGLDAAAKAASDRAVIATELFMNDPRTPLEKPKLPDTSYPKLIEGGYGLLAERLKSGQEHPLGVIDLPRAATAMVAQLQEAKPAIEDEFFNYMVVQRQMQTARGRSGMMLLRWLDPDAIKVRLNYTPEVAGEGRSSAPRRPQQEAPPLF